MTILPPPDPAACGCDGETGLLPLDAALARITRSVDAVAGTERVALREARGRVLAAPVAAQAMSPPFDNSAMDGYAVDAGALAGPGPWRLPVSERVQAGGAAAAPLRPGTAVRIFTGAPLPPGADTVVIQEDVEEADGAVVLRARPGRGLHVRRAGEDMAPGRTVLPAGRRLGGREIAVAAAAGQGSLCVRRPVRVALLVTGDEVRPAGAPLSAGQIWDVNTPMLAAAIAAEGADLTEVAHLPDDPGALADTLARVAREADLVVTSGGVSVGAADHVKPAVAALGGPPVFSGVAIKPGKPVSFGRIGDAFWLGLPGNPVSALVCWTVFGTWLAGRLAGEAAPGVARRHAVTDAALRHKPGRCELRPARLAGMDGTGREIVRCPEATHSAAVSCLAVSDGVVLIPADAEEVPEGGLVEFLPFPKG